MHSRRTELPLEVNSSWIVTAEVVNTVTTTIDNSVFALIDIDYPSVASIVDPTNLQGVPTSIEDNITNDLMATDITAATWTGHSVDFLKAGFEYALVKIEGTSTGPFAGFIKISDAAGMQGLSRIIPLSTPVANLRNAIEYASKLVKGPMSISYMLFAQNGTAQTGVSTNLVLDFVKRGV